MNRSSAVCLSLLLSFAVGAKADHGPGTSGSGAVVQSGETMKPGTWAVETRVDYTEFDDLSPAEARAIAQRVGGIDLLDRSFLYGLSISAGVVDNLQLSLSLGWYEAIGSREVEYDAGPPPEFETPVFNPDGLTDLWLTGKWRVYRGPLGNLSAIAGVKFPTGRNDVTNSHGEPVEPSATAGTGAFDGMIGVGYSVWLIPRLTLDASATYTIRGEDRDFQLGNRFETGMALAWRCVADSRRYPQINLFGEISIRHLDKSEDAGVKDPDTGGTAVFLSPGVRIGFNKHVTFSVTPQFPVLQDLNGEQLETKLRTIVQLTVEF